jgi:hypothetical protein
MSTAQKIKFGKVSKAELEEKFYPPDSSANAVILYKKRRTYFDYSSEQGWTLITKVHERIKIYNKDGYDWATKEIKLYQGGSSDESATIKAYTFNLNNGNIEKIKLKSNQIFTKEINKYWNSKKFTMPNLTEGSVIEWSYTFRSEYFTNIDDMVFQYKIPLKYIDTEVKMPEYFVYKYRPSTYYPIKINESSKNRSLNFTYRTDNNNNKIGANTTLHNAKVDLNEVIYASVERNIPALKNEPFTNNINNYRSKTSFELMAYRPKNGIAKFYNKNWEDVTKTIYESSNFGGQLKKSSYFKDDLENIVSKTDPVNEKVAKIFQFVKSKIKWNEFNSKYTSKGVKKAYKEGTGNVAEINLILVSMLREAGVNANPILVSTRSHGISLFPTSKGFNYVIAGVEIQDDVILLDATEKYSLANVLPLRALNWQGRIIRKNGSSNSISLFTKKHSKETCFLNVKIDNEGVIAGVERDIYINLTALQKRSKNNSTSESELITKLEKNYDDIEIDEFKATNKEKLSKSLIYQFKFETDNQIEIIGDKMYFSPLLFHTKKENPFKLEERKFPIDFGAPWEDKFTLSIELPEGYKIESKPENAAFSLPENLGSFKFVTTTNGNKLQVLSNIKINLPVIASLYYDSLKEFYKMVVEKQLEKVVLVKK